MSYIYDVLLNWTDNPYIYEFYEWQPTDDIEHIKKISILRVDSNTFFDIYNYKIKVSKELLTLLYQKTELFNRKSGSHIDYAGIFTDGFRAVAVEFDNKGLSIFKSAFLIEEETEIINMATKMTITILEYKVIKKEVKKDVFMTRLERKIKKHLSHEFDHIYQEKNIDKLKYLYNEWYNDQNDDVDFMYKRMKRMLNKEWTNQHFALYNLIKLSYLRKWV
ncbi:MAG: DUF3603 family protein [Bacilli bacterium]|jgi:hydroxylamine reductase (hybrid-cluster protein)